MNNERREQIESITGKLADLREQLEGIKDAEQEAFDNMPEGLQSSERGERSQEAINNLESAIYFIEEAEPNLESARE